MKKKNKTDTTILLKDARRAARWAVKHADETNMDEDYFVGMTDKQLIEWYKQLE